MFCYQGAPRDMRFCGGKTCVYCCSSGESVSDVLLWSRDNDVMDAPVSADSGVRRSCARRRNT